MFTKFHVPPLYISLLAYLPEWMGTSQLPLLLRDSYCGITLFPRVLLTEYIALHSHFRHIRLKHLL